MRGVRGATFSLKGPLSVVDDKQNVVAALSVVGATKMSFFTHMYQKKYFIIVLS